MYFFLQSFLSFNIVMRYILLATKKKKLINDTLELHTNWQRRNLIGEREVSYLAKK